MNVTRLNFKLTLIFIFGVFILSLHCKECASTKTVVFIYDKVNATGYDIEWLTTYLIQLSTECFKNGLDLQFTLKFPDKSNIASNSRALRNDSSINEGQSTLKNLLTHINEAPSYSVIYLITNVTSPNDETSVDEILEAIQIKRTEVNFLIGIESSFDDYITDSLNKYGVIASASNGYVMGPYSLTSDLFTDFIYHGLSSAPLIMHFQQVVHKDNKVYCTNGELCFDIMKKYTVYSPRYDANQHIILSGRPQRSLTEMELAVTSASHTTEMCEVLDKKYKEMGVNFLTMNPNGVGLGTSTAKDNFDFDYGFTLLKEVRSLNETYRRPISGISNEIFVSPSNKNVDYGFDYFIIRFLNETRFREAVALKRIRGTNLYAGSFYPPEKEYFFIQVAIQEKDETILRRSSTALKAATDFGEDDRNPMFEQKPIFKYQPSTGCCNSEDSTSYIREIFDGILHFLFGSFIGLVLFICLRCLFRKMSIKLLDSEYDRSCLICSSLNREK